MTAYTFTLTAADTYATVYDSDDRPAATAAAARARRAVSVLPPAMPRAFDMPDSPVMAAIEAAEWMAPDYDAGGLFA